MIDEDQARKNFMGGVFRNETVTLGPSQFTGHCVFINCVLDCTDPDQPPQMWGAIMLEGCTFTCNGEDMGSLWERLPVKVAACEAYERRPAEEDLANAAD